MPEAVCSTEHQFHHFFTAGAESLESVLELGLRPLSDFPDSDRWQEIEREMPGFFVRLYEMLAGPVIPHPYTNSGIFMTPIDFRSLPGTFLHEKPRFRIPNDRIDPEWAVITYVIDDERISLPFDEDSLAKAAAIWDETMVREWFGKDPTKAFFYVPQVAVYQPVVLVTADDYDAGVP